MTILDFRVMSAAVSICALVLATGAQAAPLFSIGYAAQQDIGTTSAASAFAPFSATTFPHTPFLPATGADADGGCDGDAFSNFGGPGNGMTGVPTCGDVLIFKGASNGALGAGANNLSDTSSPNGTGFEFYVEDSAGNGTQNSSLPETLTVGGLSNNFNLPFTVNYGFSADSFQIAAFDLEICIKNGTGGNCNAGQTNGTKYWIISPGTSLLSRGGSDDDDWAFETNLVGCVNTTDSGLGSCGTTPAPVISFSVGDPPAPAIPEPPTLAVFLFAVIALGTLQNWKRSS